jgi:hypothetical protein
VAISEKNIGLADRLPIRQKKSRLCRPIPDPTPIFPNPPILPICRFSPIRRFCRSADFADFSATPISELIQNFPIFSFNRFSEK